MRRAAAALLLVASVLVVPIAAQQSAERTEGIAGPGGAIKGADLALLKSVRRVSEDVERLRGELFKRPPVAVRTPDAMRDAAADIRAFNVLSREELEARGRSWADIGLGSPGSPAVLYRTLAADLDGIGFDPSANRLLVSPDRLDESDFEPFSDLSGSSAVLMMTGVRRDEPLVGHLLMHVRQRERRGGDYLGKTTDQLIARAAAAEGEANLIAVLYLFEGLGLATDVLRSIVDPGDFLEGSLVPPVLGELSAAERGFVTFVYTEGFAVCAEAYASGGWPKLETVLKRAQTSRELMHLDRLPLKTVMDAPSEPPAEGLTLVDRDSLGEQGIFVLVSTLTGKDNLGLIAGDGWTFDGLYRWERPGQPEAGVTEWVSRWMDTQAAKDFGYAIGRTWSARFPSGKWTEIATGERVLETGYQVLRMRIEGTEVRIRIASPALDSASGSAEGS